MHAYTLFNHSTTTTTTTTTTTATTTTITTTTTTTTTLPAYGFWPRKALQFGRRVQVNRPHTFGGLCRAFGEERSKVSLDVCNTRKSKEGLRLNP